MIQVYDTTLRDGTQREGISLSGADKLRIARKLDDLGVAFIEGGWPGSNPKDADFFERARDLPWHTAQIAAFGATCRAQGGPEDDANIQALLSAATPVCTVVGKSSTLHVTEVLRTTLDDNLRIIQASVAYLRAQGRRVIYDAEHFFDGYRADTAYALETLRAAVRGGAEIVVLCDTNGGSLPWDVTATVRAVKTELGHPLGIHTHNDGECAVANTLSDKANFGEWDFTQDMYGWESIGTAFKGISTQQESKGEMAEGADLISYRWFPGAHLDYYVAQPNHRNVYLAGELKDTHKYFWINQQRGGLRAGKDYYHIAVSNYYRDPAELFGAYFEKIEPIDTIKVMRGDALMRYAFVYRMKNFQGEK